MSQLSDYIKQAYVAGMSDDLIIAELKKAGWQEADIQAGFMEVNTPVPTTFNIQIPPQILNQQLVGDQSKTFWLKFKLPIIISGVVMALVAGSYLAYVYYFNSPQKILQKAISNMSKVESGHVKFEATINEKISESEYSSGGNFLDLFGVKNFTVTFKGDGDYKSTADVYDYNGVITVATKAFGGNISFDIEIKKIGKDYFVKVADILLSQILGQGELPLEWIKFNEDGLKKLEEMAKEEGGSASGFNINDEQIKMLQEAAKGYKYVTVDKNLGTEEINGKKTWHYKMIVDKQELKEYLKKALDIVLAKVTEIPAEDKELVYQVTEGYIDNSDITSEMWIGKSDKLIYRSVINLQMPSFFGVAEEMGKINEADVGNKQQQVELLKDVFNKTKKTFTLNIIVDSTDFNKKIEIKAPATALDIIDLLEIARIKSRDAKRIADIRQIQTALERYYGDKNSYPISATPVILGEGNFKALNEKGWSDQTTGFSIGVPTNYLGFVPSDPGEQGWKYIYCSTAIKEPDKCANSGELYMITFQLEKESSGLSAGQHTATPNGIQ